MTSHACISISRSYRRHCVNCPHLCSAGFPATAADKVLATKGANAIPDDAPGELVPASMPVLASVFAPRKSGNTNSNDEPGVKRRKFAPELHEVVDNLGGKYLLEAIAQTVCYDELYQP